MLFAFKGYSSFNQKREKPETLPKSFFVHALDRVLFRPTKWKQKKQKTKFRFLPSSSSSKCFGEMKKKSDPLLSLLFEFSCYYCFHYCRWWWWSGFPRKQKKTIFCTPVFHSFHFMIQTFRYFTFFWCFDRQMKTDIIHD